MERIELSLEKLFDSIRQAAENIGTYDSYSEILAIEPHQKGELSDTLTQIVEEFLNKEFDEEIEDDSSDFLEDDVFILSEEEEDEDDEIDEENDDENDF